MSLKNLLGVGAAALVVAACGGGVSLGDASQNLGASKKNDAGTSSIEKDCSAADACGPKLGMPAQQCPDGSIGGNTGKCLPAAGGSCAWEIRDCSADACFDATGALDENLRTCKTTADCTVVAIEVDCCGKKHAGGVNAASSAKAQTCGTDRADATYHQQGCGCDSPWTTADDGTQNNAGETPAVACSAAGRCETTYTADACAGQTLPACPAECAQFPMTGACTTGDKCRQQGSKIGDECSCSGGTWSCAPHPPLGPGCNLVCK